MDYVDEASYDGCVDMHCPRYKEEHKPGDPGCRWPDARTYEQDDDYGPYCFVCGRATDHLGEHDDIPTVHYDWETGHVFSAKPTYPELTN